MTTTSDAASVTTSSALTGPTGQQIVDEAEKFLGDAYVYGADGPNTFDCSGLTQYTYKQVGISIPRTSEEQWTFGTQITADQLQAGDLVFTSGSDGTPTDPGHVGIYDGSGNVIQAPYTGTVVSTIALGDFGATGYRRMPGVVGSGTTTGDNATGDSIGSVLGGIFSWPSEIINFFNEGYTDLTKSAAFFRAFFQPSTYVRIGAGFFGFVLLIAGLFFLAREAKSVS